MHCDSAEFYVYFRFLATLPLQVAYRGKSYEVRIESIAFSANRHEIRAYESPADGGWAIGPSYLDRAWVEEAAFRAGLKVRGGTVGAAIMEQLVREGRCEAVAEHAAADALQFKPPRHHRDTGARR